MFTEFKHQGVTQFPVRIGS